MATLPKFFKLRQTFTGPKIDGLEAEVVAQLKSLALDRTIAAGQTVAVTAGSRGIAGIDIILRAIVGHLKSLQAVPFLVPAMGSHGGGTVAGQESLLASLGITEAAVHCPIRATMDTVVLAQTPAGFPVFFDRIASEADHVFICNRIKPHTMFDGELQSGLIKMLLTGLGKLKGADIYHNAAVDYGFDEVAQTAGNLVLKKANIVGGLAILENAFGETGMLEALPQDRFLQREKELLKLATRWMAKLPFDRAHLLLVDEIGKHISGTGMDTNVIGRKFQEHRADPREYVDVRRIAVRDVVGGNATGIGYAEFCTNRALEHTDSQATWLNSVTANHPQVGMFPPAYSTDREMLGAALSTIGLTPAADARILWIKNTSRLSDVLCSVAYLAEAQRRTELDIVGDAFELPFDIDGNLPRFDSL